MNARRDRFRRAMARFEPSGDPHDAIKQGFYVEEPGQSLAQQIFARLELRPQSSHLVAGAIGSGKTTQLRVLEDSLLATGEFWPLFVDLSLRSGDFRAPGRLREQIVQRIEELRLHKVHKKIEGLGITQTILTWLANPPQQHKGLAQQLASHREKLVLVLDSLDRTSLEVFAELCSGDLAELRTYVAIVVVGPPAVMYGAARELVGRFDYFLRQPTHDPHPGTETHAFLLQVLRNRADETLLPEPACTALVASSGGILRDLIALTQLALEEAYVAGHEGVELHDVRRAVDTFGRKHIIGLDSEELATLQRVRTRGVFVRVADKDASLLITGRVLEYADEHGGTRFALHPTLVPLLEQLADP